MISGVSFDALLADKAFDADWLLQDLDQRGATAVILPKANRKIQRDYDMEVYKWRHLVENYFAKIKEFRWMPQDTKKPGSVMNSVYLVWPMRVLDTVTH